MRQTLNLIPEFGDILTSLKIGLLGQIMVNEGYMEVELQRLLKKKYLKK
jgi:hypothetical protein